MNYQPETYFTSIEKDDIPMWKHIKGYVTVVSVGTATDAAVPIQEILNIMLLLTLEQLEVS